ncbi:MAG: hypothetical protein C4K48_00050 [Candidatus Thorarchaeota archaeon]|nr:MAG: hypothetical protein C4K48_00050 [Candidatus Thorarchaeota archaeon]
MRRTCRLFALIFVAFMILGSTQVQTLAPNAQNNEPVSAQLDILRTAGYDSPNITATLSSPVNGSSVSGTFDISLDMTSDFATLNLTLFIEDAIYPAYDHASIPASPSWTQAITIDTTTLAEGMLNFTVFFENLSEKESVYLLYFVDNDGSNIEVSVYSPANVSRISGIVSIDLNISSDYNELNLTVFIDGQPLTSYNPSLIGTGNVSVLVDTSNLIEGYDNFTFYFQYDVLANHFSYAFYLVYIVDNDGVPMTIRHQSPANQTVVAGILNLTLIIGSEYEPLNFTLFVNGIIPYSQFNNSHIGIKVQIISIDTLALSEGPLDFMLLFEYNVTGENARVTYHLVFDVNNHAIPVLVILAPATDTTVTGLTAFWLNITSTHPQLYLNITVDGIITEEFNRTSILPGANNYSIDSSRYENGGHLIRITVITGEGGSAYKTLNLFFLDYVRVWISGLANYESISGVAEFRIRVMSPYDNVTVSLYVDDILASDFINRTLISGYNTVSLNTTDFSDGDHNVTIRAHDGFGHTWNFTMVLVIDNYGPPTLHFATTAAVTIGYAAFTINVDSKWSTLNVSVFVDDVVVPGYQNLTVDVSSGTYTFYIDMGAYSKTEHTVRVVMTTPEGEATQISQLFGFASIRIEELISFAFLLGLAVFIPLYRRRKGYPLKPVLIMDVVFALVTGGAFLVLGINTIPFLVWHVNMASIWSIGGTFAFANWALPLLMEEPVRE